MGKYDDDERANAYNRHIYHEFANIVQHYHDTARPAHDDIDFDADDYDGAEYDHNGERVEPAGNVYDILSGIFGAIADYGSFNDIPDNYDLPDNFYGADINLFDWAGDDNYDNDDICDRIINKSTDDTAGFRPRFFFIKFIPKKKPDQGLS